MQRSVFFGFLVSVLVLSVAQLGCSADTMHHGGGRDSGGPGVDTGVPPGDGGPVMDAGSPMHDDGGFLRSCAADSPDTEGCGCTAGSPPRACWPFTQDPRLRNVGLCADGTQACMMGAEFSAWGPCDGAYPPSTEYCANSLDDNCDGQVDCLDVNCATDPACITAHCTNGDTRPCYDGPDGTVGVGACAPGTQTCFEGTWSTDCPGEVLPAAEDCATARDLNCNHAVGCWDLFACIASPACMEHCPMPPDPGCVCADGSGDVATCPRGTHARTSGTIGGTLECCPCTSSDCGGDTNCCQESVCAGSAWCTGLYCPTLPASCMGRVSADCDDFPEDCDEPCCECYGDCSGA